MIGNAAGQKYVTKYVVDLAVEPMITEIRIYADKEGVLHIPKEYRSDVTYGANVKATDLRGGASLVMAGMVAKGDTRIENIEYILRGYEKFDQKLKNLGIDIRRIDDKPKEK